MERESVEEFLTPITPSKGRNKQQSEHEQPESPSKAQARSRLGSLLGQIRKGEGRRQDEDEQQQSRAEIMDAFDEGLGRRGPGRPKNSRREKRVVFELRGKPFGLRDSGTVEPIYSLCRKWMYGKDDDDQLEEEDLEEEEDSSAEFDNTARFKSLARHRTSGMDLASLYPLRVNRLLMIKRLLEEKMKKFNSNRTRRKTKILAKRDLLATREIHWLPAPDPGVPLMDPRPPKVQMQTTADHLGGHQLNDRQALLQNYKHHWKGVKKNWMAYNQKRQQRYTDSLQLLRTVYGIAQQNQI